MLDTFPRIKLANLPTPLQPMKNLAYSLDMKNLWIKRDDLTGISFGGNKTRKLEFVIGDALEKEADTLVTVGAVQSNHCRQTAAAAAQNGLRCILLLAGEEPEDYTGNVLLDRLFGAEIQFFPNSNFEDVSKRMDSVIDTLKDLGLAPYGIPAGAFMPIGCVAYVQAMLELKDQCDELGVYPKKIIHSVGTGGTLAGMIIGAKLADFEADVIGISVLRDSKTVKKRVREMILRMFDEYPALIDKFEPDIKVDDRFRGKGYGEMEDGVRSAIQMFGKSQGIILDPVYTAKAGLALLRMSMSGEISSDTSTILWHTGGSPALFKYGSELLGS
ncbi:MAG: 1-aminocyclopropane-1-carboxylate deaminase/D-cysteine desulfhydrase [Candidatus Thorarchaeota archaeon]|jgi:D-cysteine desulfhydrase family pyridoxal phosphate-dependent enzyme